ncbi:MAG: NADH-quinone oxidoreductase subunit J [Elusimicrobiales bacterium]|nr:NADH-quinone oxidoreductase subunit J [Elusimicrobiales bacterium]
MIFYLLIYFIIVVAAAMAIMSKKLLNSAVMLALLSIGISILLFAYNAPWAAVFELSVCAGLITVLFISAVSLVKNDEDALKEKRVKYTVFPLILVGFAVIASIFVPEYFANLFQFASFNPANNPPLGDMIWLYRGFDIIGQITLLAASIFVIKHIFTKETKNEH